MSGKQRLGNKIKALRIQKGYSQEKLAELLDISIRSLSRIETDYGLPSVETLHKLATILQFNINGILEEENIKIPEKNPLLNKLLNTAENLPDKKLKFLIATAKMLKEIDEA